MTFSSLFDAFHCFLDTDLYLSSGTELHVVFIHTSSHCHSSVDDFITDSHSGKICSGVCNFCVLSSNACNSRSLVGYILVSPVYTTLGLGCPFCCYSCRDTSFILSMMMNLSHSQGFSPLGFTLYQWDPTVLISLLMTQGNGPGIMSAARLVS